MLSIERRKNFRLGFANNSHKLEYFFRPNERLRSVSITYNKFIHDIKFFCLTFSFLNSLEEEEKFCRELFKTGFKEYLQTHDQNISYSFGIENKEALGGAQSLIKFVNEYCGYPLPAIFFKDMNRYCGMNFKIIEKVLDSTACDAKISIRHSI